MYSSREHIPQCWIDMAAQAARTSGTVVLGRRDGAIFMHSVALYSQERVMSEWVWLTSMLVWPDGTHSEPGESVMYLHGLVEETVA
jgi:hypothetical protein